MPFNEESPVCSSPSNVCLSDAPLRFSSMPIDVLATLPSRRLRQSFGESAHRFPSVLLQSRGFSRVLLVTGGRGPEAASRRTSRPRTLLTPLLRCRARARDLIRVDPNNAASKVHLHQGARPSSLGALWHNALCVLGCDVHRAGAGTAGRCHPFGGLLTKARDAPALATLREHTAAYHGVISGLGCRTSYGCHIPIVGQPMKSLTWGVRRRLDRLA